MFCAHLFDDAFGTVADPTNLGDEFVWAVRARMGVSADQARELIGLAFDNRQLDYVKDAQGKVTYSNYIGWWANEKKEYLGFWDGKSMDGRPENARYAVKSYGMLGENEDPAMLYSYIDVCLDATGDTANGGEDKGETTLVWSVPASLLPTVVYSVELLDDLEVGDPAKVSIQGAESPIRLVFEVGLCADYSNPATIAAMMVGEPGEESAAGDTGDIAYRKSGGTYTFFTNEWKKDLASYSASPITHTNTTAYFEPSFDNERYHHIEDNTILVSDGSGGYKAYEGTTAPPASGEYYFSHYIYEWTSSPESAKVGMHYAKLGAAALGKAQKRDGSNTWYIPKGTYLGEANTSSVDKTDGQNVDYAEDSDNPTKTLRYSDYSVLGETTDDRGTTTDEDDVLHQYEVSALGNNGSISIQSLPGIILSKEVEGEADPNAQFSFTIQGPDAVKNQSYLNGAVAFGSDGKAVVALKAGNSLNIMGLPSGEYTVQETGGLGSDFTFKEAILTDGPFSAQFKDNDPIKFKIGEGGSPFVLLRYVNKTIDHRDVILTKKVTGVDADKLPDGLNSFDFKISFDYTNASEGTIKAKYKTSKGEVEPKNGDSSYSSGASEKVYSFDVLDMKADEVFFIHDVPVGTKVTVTEVLSSNSKFVFDAEASNLPASGVEVGNIDITFTAVNAYKPTELNPSIHLTVNKVLKGRDLNNSWADSDEFSFRVQQRVGAQWVDVEVGDGASATAVGGTASKKTEGGEAEPELDLSAKFNAVEFNSAGEYWFRVIEFVPDPNNAGQESLKDQETVGGVTYYRDAHTFVVTVEDVLDNAGKVTGKLRIAGVSTRMGEDAVSDHHTVITKNESGAAYAYTVATHFENTYKATGAIDVTAVLKKIVENKTGDSSFDDDLSPVGYNFGMFDEEERLISQAEILNPSGEETRVHSFSFLKDLTHANPLDNVNDEGEHWFYIQEIPHADRIQGMTYDSTKHWFKITVSDNGDGTLKVEGPVWIDYETAAPTLTFTNGFYPPPPVPADPSVSVTLSATKTLDGVACGDGKFSFELKDVKGDVVRTAVNGAGGAVSFGSLSFDEAGAYEYTISEKIGSDEGIEYDSAVYKVAVTVTEDAAGNLSAATAITKDGAAYSGTPAFANKTKHEPVEVTLSATKTLDGKAPGAKVFGFMLMRDGKHVDSATNDAAGNVTFNTFKFDTEGVYKYVLSEVAGDDEGIVYDSATYEITVTVTKGEDGKLAAAVSTTKGGAAYSGTPAFANEAKPGPDPEPGDKPSDPPAISPTGDTSGLWLLVGLTCASAAVLLLALRMLKRRA